MVNEMVNTTFQEAKSFLEGVNPFQRVVDYYRS
jgi:hypothetical protein